MIQAAEDTGEQQVATPLLLSYSDLLTILGSQSWSWETPLTY